MADKMTAILIDLLGDELDSAERRLAGLDDKELRALSRAASTLSFITTVETAKRKRKVYVHPTRPQRSYKADG